MDHSPAHLPRGQKRPPEPGEFSYACANAVGLNDITNDWEWITRFSFNVVQDAVNEREGVAATAMGNGNCTKSGTGWVANTDDTPSTLAYRCSTDLACFKRLALSSARANSSNCYPCSFG